MNYTLLYVHAKLKAVKGQRLRGNTGIVHLGIVRWNLLKRNIELKGEKYGGRALSQKRWPDLCCDFEN